MARLDLNGVGVEYSQHGSGPSLVLIHSLLTEMTVFDRVLPALEARYRVTRFNLPGFGTSDTQALDAVADWADHVARVMRALELPDDTTVFGNGFGAFVCAELAVRHGEMFDKLVLADVVPDRKTKLAQVAPDCFGRACRALATMDLTARLPTIRNPTLVMCGALDLTTPPALAREVAALIPGAEYHEIAASGHCPMLEQPQALVAKIVRFAG